LTIPNAADVIAAITTVDVVVIDRRRRRGRRRSVFAGAGRKEVVVMRWRGKRGGGRGSGAVVRDTNDGRGASGISGGARETGGFPVCGSVTV
jgi:hypothetical protein